MNSAKKYYEIWSYNGHSLGAYFGETIEAAHAAMCKDAGHGEYDYDRLFAEFDGTFRAKWVTPVES